MNRVFYVAIVAFLFIFRPTAADDRRPDPTRLVIMTFNVEFMWDGLSPEEGAVEFSWKNDPEAARRKMADIAKVIRRHDPDIVHLCEVENLEALTLLNDTFLADQRYKPHFVQGRDTFTGQDVALLTRVDPDSMRYDDREGTSGDVRKNVSKHYVARLTIGDTRLALIGVHLLAGPWERARLHKRQAQADAVTQMAAEEARAGYQVIVLGDLNDYDGVDRDHLSREPITNVLARIRQLDPQTTADNLVNLIAFVPQPERYTVWADLNENDKIESPEECAGVDHILVSRDLARRLIEVTIDHRHDPRIVSDHFPVIARFR
jgi:exonuclease III